MDPLLMVLVAIVAALVLWIAWTFNRLIRARNGVAEAWSTVDVELTRRHNLVPRLADAVRGYASHESGLFERVALARSRATTGDPVAESTLTGAIRSLFAVAEAYPELKASENFASLQQELATTEDRIAYARSYYNAWVTDYETLRQTFPRSLVASAFRFPTRSFFEADVTSRAPISVALGASAGAE
ncbi:MAG: LemA family protein [Dehalococcoidia bacterium]|nr:LemA family protein [Dehalococcoidia bacterium]